MSTEGIEGYEPFGSGVIKVAERVVENSIEKNNTPEPPNPFVNKFFKEAGQEQIALGNEGIENIEETVRHAASSLLLAARKHKEDSQYGHRRQRTMRKSHDFRQADKSQAEGKDHSLRGIKEEEHLPDHPPELEIFLQKKFLEKVAETAMKTKESHQDATLDDLVAMIEAEKDDQLKNRDTIDMMRTGIKTAKDYLQNHLTLKRRINKVNVSVSQSEAGKWAGAPRIEADKSYFTFTRGRIAELTNKLKFYETNLNFLNYASEALQKISDNRPLDETEYDAQALYTYLREKEDYFAKGLMLATNPQDKEKLEHSRRMFGKLLLKVYAYPQTISPSKQSSS